MYFLFPRLSFSDLWQENQYDDYRGNGEETDGVERGVEVDVVVEGHVGDDHHGKHHAGDVDRHGDVLGVVQALDGDLARAKCQENGDDLQDGLVAEDDTQPNVAAT